MYNIIVIGAGGHAKVIADIIIKNGDKIIGFLDDNSSVLPIIGRLSECVALCEAHNAKGSIAVGNNEIRKNIAEQYAMLAYYTAVHPSASVAGGVALGAGTVVMANAVVNPGTVVGAHCIINTSASVDHDCIIGDYVHISPGATVCGGVHVGDNSWICAGATVINNIHICPGCIIGAGAVVIKDISKPGTYIGVPAGKVQNS